ncbi:unnamed protein product [Commensalibacter communis]|uniref:hypothetical protein n=1 Tax=Commensalibacter communis TaxID=2972786 RepID=UPI0022FF54A7|nr:hypothetical protein [Commensalibacter communis]CAI3953126.1 unnamed protein product [Commensalibacter communis]
MAEQKKNESQIKPIAVPVGNDFKGKPYAMANPHEVAMAKQMQSIIMTNNNQKFDTVINVTSMATDPKVMAQEIRQALNNRMLVQAYGVTFPESQQYANPRLA